MTEAEVRQAVFDYIDDHGIKITHVADRGNMTKQKLNLIKRGAQRMSLTDYLTICDALQLPYSYFFEEAK